MYKHLSCNSSSIDENILINDFQQIFNNNICDIPQQIVINNYMYETNFVLKECNVLFNKIRKIIRIAEDLPLGNATLNFDINAGRIHVVEILTASRCNILLAKSHTEVNEAQILKIIHLLMSSIYSIQAYNDQILNKLLSSNIQNNELPLSQYFHLYFDIQWLSLTILYLSTKNKEVIHGRLIEILQDLIFIANASYKKHGPNYSPFTCPCIQMLWCTAEQFIGKVWDCEMNFWDLYNKLIGNHDEIFILWLTHHLAVSNKYAKDNCILIEQTLKSTTKSNNNNTKLLEQLQIIKPMVNDLWLDKAKIEPYLILWDYFFKQLNTMELEIPNNFIDVNTFCNNSKELNAYQTFISMLSVHLKTHKSHWSKLKGRIYSRLPAHKIADFSHFGIFNISLFFLGLIEVNFEELSKKLLEILANAPKNNLELLCMIYTSLIMKYITNQRELTSNICEPICKILEDLSSSREKFYVIKNFLEGFEYILNCSSNYQLKQYTIFGNWILKFITACQYTDLCYLINVLIWIAQRIHNSDDFYKWMFAYTKFVLPAIKNLIITPNAPPQSGELIAIMLKNISDKNQLIMYLNNYNISTAVINNFLCTLLEDYPEVKVVPSNSENVLVQLWINCLILNNEINGEITSKILKFDLLSALNFNGAQNSLQNLFKAITNSNHLPLYKLKSLCDSIFGHVDNFIKHIFNTALTDSNSLYIYKFVGELFQYCSTLIYDKSKSNCLLSRLISMMLLPTDVLMGKPPKISTQKAIEHNYHLFIEGLFKLDYNNDPFIERTLKDLIIKYIPHFATSNSPILLCLNNISMCEFVLDKINRNFLLHSSKCNEEISFKALKILHVALEQCTEENIIRLIVKMVFPGILEIIMFNVNKTVAIDLVKMLALSDWYVHVRDEMKVGIQIVLEKHLAFNSNNFFQLITVLIKLMPLDIKTLLPAIKKQIVIVEKMRGVGYDSILRNSLYKVETAL